MIYANGTAVQLKDGKHLVITNGPSKWDFVTCWANELPMTFTVDLPKLPVNLSTNIPGIRAVRGGFVTVTCRVLVGEAGHESGGGNSFNISGQFTEDSMIQPGTLPTNHTSRYLRGYYSTKTHDGFLLITV